MPARYSIVQYIPDPIADERINIGVVAFNQEVVRVRFLHKWERVRAFANQDIEFLREFARSVSQSVSANEFGREVAYAYGLDGTTLRHFILAKASEPINTIQVTEPRVSSKRADVLLADITARFLSES